MRQNNPLMDYEFKLRQSKRGVARNLRKRLQVQSMLGGKCVKCGFRDWRALAIDHVAGNGYCERKEKRLHGEYLYNHIIKNGTGGYQLLCYNCNEIKRIENSEYKKYKYPSKPIQHYGA